MLLSPTSKYGVIIQSKSLFSYLELFYICIMKSLCLLFAMFVLLAAVRPCCSDRECEFRSKRKNILSKKHSTKKECQGCSPFFSCNSCVGFIVIKTLFHVVVLTTEMENKDYAPYHYPGLANIVLAIWQPPQISILS